MPHISPPGYPVACPWAQEGTAGSQVLSETGPGQSLCFSPQGDLGSWLMLKSPPTAPGAEQRRSEHVSYSLWDPWTEVLGLGPFFSVSFPTQSPSC